MAAVDAIDVLIHVNSSIGWDVGYYLRLKVQLFEEDLPDTEVAAQSLTTIRRWVERGADPDGWKEDWGLDPAAAALRAAKKRDNGSAGKQGGGKEPKIPAEDPVLPSVEQLQGAVPHVSAGLPTKQVAVAARPQGLPVKTAKGKMPVGNNTAVKGPMDHFLKPTNTLQPQGAQLSQRAREKMPVGRLAQTEKTETQVRDILKISEALSGSMADYPKFTDALSRNHGNVTDAIQYLLNQAAELATNVTHLPMMGSGGVCYRVWGGLLSGYVS
jgi:hypothetical protein